MALNNQNTALVCSGGGAIGAYQVGVIKYMYEHFCDADGKPPFSLFSGVSAGALNATYLASHSDQRHSNVGMLEKKWRQFHVPEYHQDVARALIKSVLKRIDFRTKNQPPWSIFDPKPMYDVVERSFRHEALRRCFELGTTKGLAIAATETDTSMPVWFLDGPEAVSWNAFHSIGTKSEINMKHIVASCSIPIFLPPVQIGHNYYVDGSVRMIKPLAGAVAMGARKIVLIRSSAVRHPILPGAGEVRKPDFRNLITSMINALIYDHSYTELEQVTHSMRLHHAPGDCEFLYDGIADDSEEVVNSRPQVDVFSIFPTRTPKQIFDQFLTDHDLRGITDRYELMFHRGFVTRLIDYGYEDCVERHDSLQKFFLRDPHLVLEPFKKSS